MVIGGLPSLDAILLDDLQPGAQPGGGIWGISPPGNFQNIA